MAKEKKVEAPKEVPESVDTTEVEESDGPVREVIEGVPENLPARTQKDDKGRAYPVWFVAEVTGGYALYDLSGHRNSGVESDTNHLSKAAARYNQFESQKRRLG